MVLKPYVEHKIEDILVGITRAMYSLFRLECEPNLTERTRKAFPKKEKQNMFAIRTGCKVLREIKYLTTELFFPWKIASTIGFY